MSTVVEAVGVNPYIKGSLGTRLLCEKMYMYVIV